MNQLVADFFALPDYTCCFPDDPGRVVDYRNQEDPANPFRMRFFLESAELGEAPSLAAMALEWTAEFGDRIFSFQSFGGVRCGRETAMWERHFLGPIDRGQLEAAAMDALSPWREFELAKIRNMYARLRVGGEWPSVAFLNFAATLRGIVASNVLGYAVGAAAV